MSQDFSQAGTTAVGATYTPVIITTDDYGDIRRALGFAGDNITDVPVSLIEARPFLRATEAGVRRAVTNATTLVDTGDVDYDSDVADLLKEGTILLTAARLAEVWFAARVAEEVTAEDVAGVKQNYRTGPEWCELADKLQREGLASLSLAVTPEAGDAPMVTVILLAGPTARRRRADDARTTEEWLSLIYPPILSGETDPVIG